MNLRNQIILALVAGGLTAGPADAQLALNIDQGTGEAVIVNTGGATVNLNGYLIRSPQDAAEADDGLLNFGGWTTLQSSLANGWLASAAAGSEALGETNANDVLSLAPGASQPIGNAFTTDAGVIGDAQEFAEFGNEYRDLTFTYNDADNNSNVVAGAVNYTNEIFNDLVLNVDVGLGTIELQNESAAPVTIGFYSIFSAGGALNPGGFNGLRDTTVGQNWTANLADNTALSEIAPLDTSNAEPPGSLDVDELITIAGGGTFDLGGAFSTGGAQDLEFTFFMTTDGATGSEETGVVRYAGLIGDYNEDGTVDVADYTVWRDNLGTGFVLPNRDGAITGDVNINDYSAWVANFGQTLANASAAATPAPEPTAAMLAMASMAAVLASSRRR